MIIATHRQLVAARRDLRAAEAALAETVPGPVTLVWEGEQLWGYGRPHRNASKVAIPQRALKVTSRVPPPDYAERKARHAEAMDWYERARQAHCRAVHRRFPPPDLTASRPVAARNTTLRRAFVGQGELP